MKEILLTKGKVALVDDEDYELVNSFHWYAHKNHKKGDVYYARKYLSFRKHIFMHNFIMQPPKGFFIDHINRDTLDNRRCNLRLCNTSQNIMNRKGYKDKTKDYGFKGISFEESRGKFGAQIGFNNKHLRIGRFKTAEEAAMAYDKKALELYGDFAVLNFPELKEQYLKTIYESNSVYTDSWQVAIS